MDRKSQRDEELERIVKDDAELLERLARGPRPDVEALAAEAIDRYRELLKRLEAE